MPDYGVSKVGAIPGPRYNIRSCLGKNDMWSRVGMRIGLFQSKL
jgi:hypothetical protein